MNPKWERKVDELVGTGKERKALHILNTILKETSNSQEPLFYKAHIHELLGETKAALKTYLKLEILLEEIDELEDQTFVLNAIGRLYNRLGNLEKAVIYYKKVIERIEKNKNSLAPHIIEQREFRMLDIAGILEQEGEYRKALTYYLSLIRIHKNTYEDPDLTDDFTCTGRMYFQLRNYREAITYFLKALHHKPQNLLLYDRALLHFYMGKSYYHLQRFEKAKKYLTRCEKEFKQNLMDSMFFTINKNKEVEEALHLLKKIEARTKPQNRERPNNHQPQI